MQGIDSVVHMAYLQGTQTFYAEPRQVLDVAMRGMLNVLAACEATGSSELLLVSSSEAYQVASVVPTPETIPLTVPDVLNPRYSYGGGKIACELMSLAWARTGVLDRLIIVRPHNIYGPDMGNEHVIPEFCHKMNMLTKGNGVDSSLSLFRVPGWKPGLSVTSMTASISSSFYWRRLTLSGLYHVGTMDERTISDVAHAVAQCYDRKIKVIPGTLPKGSPPRRLPELAKMYALGYTPRMSFKKGIARTVAWYQEHPKNA